MRKLHLIIVTLAILLCCTLSVTAHAAVSGDYAYTLRPDGTAEITGYTGQENVLQIPDQLDGHTVAAIGDSAFAGNLHLSAVYIPGCVGYIGESAFSGCEALISVSIGDQIAYVDMERDYAEAAFVEAASIGMLTADGGQGKTSLSDSFNTAYQPILSVRAIQSDTYMGKEKLTFHCTVDPFLGRGFLYQAVSQEELDKILAWEEQTGIQVLYPISEEANRYGANVWFEANKRGVATTPYSEDMVLTPAFMLDKNGDPVRWRSSGDSLRLRVLSATYYQYLYGHDAVYPTRSTPLFTVSNAAPAPEGLTIAENAFYYCNSLCAISLPADTRDVAENALFMLHQPYRIVPYGSNAECALMDAYYLTYTLYADKDGVAPGDDPVTYTSGDFQYRVLADQSARITFCTAFDAQELTIPDHLDGHPVTAISNTALRGCSDLALIRIPASVTELNGSHFNSLSSLTAIEVAEDNPVLASINGVLVDKASMTLLYCPQAAHVGQTYTVPQGVRAIGGGAFRWSSILSIKLPDSVQSVGPMAFFWAAGLDSVEIPDSVTSLGKCAFFWCKALTSVRIPKGVTVIEDHLFEQCEALPAIEIHRGVTAIGERAFSACISLTELAIPDSVTVIEASAFQNCTQLGSITIPDSITAIEPYVFAGCRSLTEITIPGSIRSIGDYAFYSCYLLQSVTIQPAGGNLPAFLSFLKPSGDDAATTIGEYAFSLCDSLTSVTLPENVTFIADTAFDANESNAYSFLVYRGTFYVPADSYAHQWCREHGFNFDTGD